MVDAELGKRAYKVDLDAKPDREEVRVDLAKKADRAEVTAALAHKASEESVKNTRATGASGYAARSAHLIDILRPRTGLPSPAGLDVEAALLSNSEVSMSATERRRARKFSSPAFCFLCIPPHDASTASTRVRKTTAARRQGRV